MSSPRSLCPRCKLRRRAVQDAIEASRDDRKHMAPYCEQCMVAEGYVQRVEDREVNEIHGKRIMRLTWWEMPTDVLFLEPEADFFARLNGPTALEKAIARDKALEGAHRRTPRTPSALRLAPRKERT